MQVRNDYKSHIIIVNDFFIYILTSKTIIMNSFWTLKDWILEIWLIQIVESVIGLLSSATLLEKLFRTTYQLIFWLCYQTHFYFYHFLLCNLKNHCQSVVFCTTCLIISTNCCRVYLLLNLNQYLSKFRNLICRYNWTIS